MFIKLLKHELKSVGKWYFALNAGVLLASLFLALSIKPLIDYSQYNSYSDNTLSQLIPMTLTLIFGVLVTSAWVATLFIIVKRFNHNIFGREGYLTLTLPVSTHHIILAKLISSLIWMIFNSLVLFLSIVTLIIPISGVGAVLISIPYLFQVLEIGQWALLAVDFILSILSGTLLIYLAISIGQLFTNKRTLMGFVSFFCLLVIGFIISSISGTYFDYQNDLTFNSLFIYDSFRAIIQILVFYFATHYILKNKLNIQ